MDPITASADYLLVEMRKANLPLDVQVRGTHICFLKSQPMCRKRLAPNDKEEGGTFRAPRTISPGLNTAKQRNMLSSRIELCFHSHWNKASKT